MAEKSSFFTSLNGDRKYKSSDFAEYFSTFIGNGVFPNPSNNLLVTSNGDMTINLSAGFAWINGYMYHNTDNLTLTVEHADSALKRIDRVVLRCDFINREIKAYVKKGKFATSPTSPALERSVNAYELSVADILVENGVISIQQSKITDTRLDESVCGIVTQTVKEIETSELYRKLQGYIDERGQDVKGWIETATTQWGIDFNTWFQTIKDILSGDVAGALADRILELENKVNNLDLVASKVTMSDGNTVEDAITANKTSILNNTSLANQALTRANEAFQRGDNVKKQLVDKLISEGLSSSTNNTFEQLINSIYIGKRCATGTTYPIKNTYGFKFLVRELGFKPSFVLIFNPNSGSTAKAGSVLFNCNGFYIQSNLASTYYKLGKDNPSDSVWSDVGFYNDGFKIVTELSLTTSTQFIWIAYE